MWWAWTTRSRKESTSINLLGEYNIGGDAFEIERMFEKCGITLVASFSGNSSIEAFANSHTADLNLIMCHRSINYVAEMMETKFGVPWIKVNFIGAAATAKSLRKIAQYFDEQELTDKVEAVIAEEMPAVETACAAGAPPTPKASGPCCLWAAPAPTITRSCSAKWA